jgi:hypothetical protein|tara:strand:+ start:334 stop:744 length:411 start_codon:yes stop_codon:yes gene_type:complete
MKLFSVVDMVQGIFKPAAKLVDELHTSEEERMDNKLRMLELQAAAVDKATEYHQALFESQAKIVNSEASSSNLLTSSWRPIVMLTFTGLVVARYLGFEAPNMTPEDHENLWTLIQLGLGGYVMGRSVEKTVNTWKK